jgi:WhiB family redox-sensing transcriptional regulator
MPDVSWRDAAACRDADPELFFPIGRAGPALRQIDQARRICKHRSPKHKESPAT